MFKDFLSPYHIPCATRKTTNNCDSLELTYTAVHVCMELLEGTSLVT